MLKDVDAEFDNNMAINRAIQSQISDPPLRSDYRVSVDKHTVKLAITTSTINTLERISRFELTKAELETAEAIKAFYPDLNLSLRSWADLVRLNQVLSEMAHKMFFFDQRSAEMSLEVVLRNLVVIHRQFKALVEYLRPTGPDTVYCHGPHRTIETLISGCHISLCHAQTTIWMNKFPPDSGWESNWWRVSQANPPPISVATRNGPWERVRGRGL